MAQVVDKYGWKFESDGTVLAEGQRITFGTTSRKCVKAFARRAWARNMLARDRRGRDLQSQQQLRGSHPRIDILQRYLGTAAKNPMDGRLKHAMVLGAPDDAHYHSRRLATYSLPRCRCGLRLPNARHIAWHCEFTRTKQQICYGNPEPSCGLQEAYLLEFDEFSAPAPDEDTTKVVSEVALHLQALKAACVDERIFVATDGGTAGKSSLTGALPGPLPVEVDSGQEWYPERTTRPRRRKDLQRALL